MSNKKKKDTINELYKKVKKAVDESKSRKNKG